MLNLFRVASYFIFGIYNTEEEKDLSQVLLFLINKTIIGKSGPIAFIWKVQNGRLLSKISSQKQSLSLLKITIFFNPVKLLVELQRSSNYSKGVVIWRHLLHITLEKMKTELSKQSMFDVTSII